MHRVFQFEFSSEIGISNRRCELVHIKNAPFIPEAHTLLMVVQITEYGNPAPNAACLAGAWPKFALRTFPKKTSCTRDGSTFALFRAAVTLKMWVRYAKMVTMSKKEGVGELQVYTD